jgi:NAD(P)-dependent dehydrogenase (short-subunit alcohol dehydrogenase family)
MSAYTASKAGVEAMTDALRIETSITDARVGCAYFGFVDTDLVRGSYEHPATQALNRIQPGFLKRPIPLAEAIDVIERGIDRRAARLWAPRFVGPMMRARGLLQPAVDRVMAARRRHLRDAIRLADPATGGAPPVDARLGVAVQDGHAAGDHGSAADLV